MRLVSKVRGYPVGLLDPRRHDPRLHDVPPHDLHELLLGEVHHLQKRVERRGAFAIVLTRESFGSFSANAALSNINRCEVCSSAKSSFEVLDIVPDALHGTFDLVVIVMWRDTFDFIALPS